jgi:hypothetical protein
MTKKVYELEINELTKSIKRKDEANDNDDNDIIFNKKNFTYLICGKKNSGKSSLILSLLDTPVKEGGFKKEFNHIILVSPTAQRDDKFTELVNELSIDGLFYDELNQENMNDIMEKIKGLLDNFDTKKKKKSKPHILVIFDDCVHTMPSNRKKNQTFNKLMLQNRHYNTSIVILTQRFNELSPLVRSQADIVSYFNQNNKTENKMFCDMYDIDPDMLQYATGDAHSFLTVSFTHSMPIYYKKFDKIKN